jgi:hypothetical protein
MANGQEVVVFNTLERAVSEDLDRLQAFQARDLAEALRFLIDVYQGTDDLDAGGLSVETTSLTAPLKAEVLGGFLVQPQNGTPSLLVTDGVAYCVNPDVPAQPDNSVFQYVRDPGVNSLGQLVLTPNATGSVRVDVVECQPNVVVTETDSRDFYNQVTGLFAPLTVTKAQQGAMTYRVRAGTAGSGFPGVATGWLPLCVVVLQPGATSCDACDFWDVRPMLSDRAFGVANVGSSYPDVRGSLYAGDSADASNPTLVAGNVSAILGGRRVGGNLLSGTPGADPSYGLDLANAKNQSPGLSSNVTTNTGVLWYLYLVCPFGLPRWARYSPLSGSAQRVPRSPRGIPVVSDLACEPNGLASSTVPLPTALFGASTSDANAVCVAAVPRRYSGGTPWSVEDKFVSWGYQDPTGLNLFVNTAVPGAGDGVTLTYDTTSLTPTRLPPCAVRCRFLAGWTVNPGAASQTGWHYAKTLTLGGSSGPTTRNAVREGVVWLPSDYFSTTGVDQQDAMWGDFDVQNNNGGITLPTFFVKLLSGDSTVAIGTAGSAPHIVVPNLSGTLTAGGFLGYWNP